MPRRPAILSSLALAALALSACNASAPTTSAGNPAAVTTPPASTNPGASQASPGGSAPSGGLPIPGLNADPALEAQLPTQVRGTTLQKLSFRGSDFLSFAGGEDNDLKNMFERLGTSPANMSVALAIDTTDQLGAQTFAFKLAGTDANRLLQELVSSARAENKDVVIGQVTLGGKSATTITNPASSEGVIYAYAKGDTVFAVQATNQQIADEILRQMP
jgi:hypothetical protein